MPNLKTSWECIFIGIQYIIAIIVKRQLYLNQNKCSRDLESFREKFTLFFIENYPIIAQYWSTTFFASVHPVQRHS